MKHRMDNITVAIQKDVQYIREDVNEIKTKLERNYITREEFEPIKRVVYGMVTTMLLAVLAAITQMIFAR